MGKKKLTTGLFARLLEGIFDTSEATVRGWCESGALKAYRGPQKNANGEKTGHYSIVKKDVPRFLKDELELDEQDIQEVVKKLPGNFTRVA